MQMETIYEEEHDEVQTILDDLESIKNMIFNLQQELRATRVHLLELVHTQHKEQMKQIEACREAFKLNVQRDEDLMTALSESANPWDGS